MTTSYEIMRREDAILHVLIDERDENGEKLKTLEIARRLNQATPGVRLSLTRLYRNHEIKCAKIGRGFSWWVPAKLGVQDGQ